MPQTRCVCSPILCCHVHRVLSNKNVCNSLCASRKNTVVVSRIIVKFGSAAWLTLFQQKVLDFLSSREYRETVWNRCWFSFSHVTNMKFWKKIRIWGPKTETKSRAGRHWEYRPNRCPTWVWLFPHYGMSSSHCMVLKSRHGLHCHCFDTVQWPDKWTWLIWSINRTEKSRNILHSCQSDICPFTNSTTKEWVQAQKHW